MKRQAISCGILLAACTIAALPRADGQNAQWGDITGQILWGGNVIPVQAPIAVPPGVMCAKPPVDETWVVNPKSKGLKNTFVWLEPAQKGGAIPIHPALAAAKPNNVEVDQPACAFVPNSVALRAGDVLIAKNSSLIAHNFKYTGNPIANPGGNPLIPPAQQVAIPGLVADRLPIAMDCSIHPWMRGWIRVFDHPYFAVTDDDGKFTIKDAPAGNFTMKIWHGSGGWLGGAKGKNGQPIAIKAGQNPLPPVNYVP